MGNCQDVRRQDDETENSIYAPEQKQSRIRERTQNETSMKFTQLGEDDPFFGQEAEYHKILEMPRKMIRKPAPKFQSNMYHEGVAKVSLDDYAGKYLVLFFYPFDFNKMFQDEILDFSENTQNFKKLNCELLGCSIDSHFSHMNYCTKPRSEGGLGQINYPLMADVDRKIASDYGVLISNGSESGTCLRSTFIIDDYQIVRHLAINDFAGHLKAEEILRMVKGIQDGDKASGKPSAKPKTLYDRVGGEEAVTAAVAIFYKKMLADSKVSHFFKTIDMNKQHAQQTSFLCSVLGGPKKYVGKNMKDAHSNLKLSTVEFDVTVGHLVGTLKELNVDAETIAEIGKLVEPLRKDIVYVPPPTIYEQIGGDKALESAVDIFYKKVLEDGRLSPFFKDIDMTKQRGMMKAFLTMGLGGSKDYSGRNMKDSHQHLNLTDVHFDAIIIHLTATLKQLNVDESIIQKISGFIEPLRKDIVNPKPQPQPNERPPSGPIQTREATTKTIGTPKSMASAQGTPVNSIRGKYLFDRIGGEAKVEQLVNSLLDRVYKDARINSFFANIDQDKLKVTVKTFLIQFTGGSKGYQGKNLKEAHSNMKINDVQFNIFVNHLRDSLISMKVEPSVFHEFCNMFESFRAHIVSVKLSIFERLGGENAIANISERLYAKVTADARIKEFFVNTNMTRLKEMQKNFLMFATGGPKKYNGKNMKDAHAHIKINDIHFNAYKENLLLTLKELLVDPQTFQEISGLIETQRLTIVNVTLPLLERLGGDPGVLAIVNRFYDRILLDPRIKKFFAGIDMQRLRSMNHQFILYSVKGPAAYAGKNMKEAHAKLALNDTHFNLVKDHLIQSMRDCSRDPLSMNEVGNLVEGLRNDIVSVKLPLIERIGGDQVMKKAVERFYARALADPRMKDMFKNVDMNNQKVSQNNFLTMLMGGANNYSGKNMKEAHAKLKINDQLFNTFKEYILQSFRELGIDNITVMEIARLIEFQRKDVVSVRPTIYERLGGENAMELIIGKFYDKLLKNANIGQFFASIDQTKQKTMLKAFFTGVLGGQPVYRGKNLTTAHSHFKVTDAMFAEFRTCMEQTLKEMSMNPMVIKDVGTVIEHFKKEIVR